MRLTKALFFLSLGMALLVAAVGGPGGRGLAAPDAPPFLEIPRVSAHPGESATLGVTFTTGTYKVSVLIFSIDIDQNRLIFDTTDGPDLDLAPDSVKFYLPPGFSGSVAYNPADADGELDFSILMFGDPMLPLNSAKIVDLTLQVKSDPVVSKVDAPVVFSVDPAPSFGESEGGSAPPGESTGGAVEIQPVSPTPTDTPKPPTATPTPTKTVTPPQASPTPTAPVIVLPPVPGGKVFIPIGLRNFSVAPVVQPPPGDCYNAVKNGGFETRGVNWNVGVNWDVPATAYSADWTKNQKHSGTFSMRTGIPSGTNVFSYSSASQTLSIPAGADSAFLSLWAYRRSSEPDADRSAAASDSVLADSAFADSAFAEPYLANSDAESELSTDLHYILVEDQASGTRVFLMRTLKDTQAWGYYEYNLASAGGVDFRGKTVRLFLGSFNDGAGGLTSMYLDDVMLTICR